MSPALNFRTLDLNLLRVFDVVMAERNLTRAAERLSLTQPAVSNALKRLREAVGEDLLTRSAHGVVPTPRAEALWPEVRSALGRLRGVLAPGEFDPAADAANFRIAMADATAALFMPSLVAQIEQGGAQANLRSLPLTVRDPTALLERGDADIAVGFFPETVAALLAQGANALLRRQRLSEGEYICVMRRGHPLAKQPLTLDAYCAAHHLLVSLSGRDTGLADQVLAGLNRKRRVVLTVNQYFTAGRVVAKPLRMRKRRLCAALLSIPKPGRLSRVARATSNSASARQATFRTRERLPTENHALLRSARTILQQADVVYAEPDTL